MLEWEMFAIAKDRKNREIVIIKLFGAMIWLWMNASLGHLLDAMSKAICLPLMPIADINVYVHRQQLLGSKIIDAI
ncbi:uncharacterized protein Dwil_GK28095 [Drosophila willistoni]|uniref:Uncharacterized protein n=1 Tax=Drosophila willistoni TaxID=7260 RepID=A0A0Q9WS83_DROWI|nr:uncharacterized protein Dwil_GK28095 [Drosophila willistoni]